MIKLLLLLVLVAEPEGVTYRTKVVRVIDGDTIVIAAPFLPKPLEPELAVRIYGVDTPERGGRAECIAEAKQGKQAYLWVKEKIEKGKLIELVLYDWDKFGGRVLGDILVDGQSIRKGLIESGLGREYYGDKKQSWCK